MRQEQAPQPELPAALVEAYAATFIARFDCYPVQREDGSYIAVKEALTFAMVEAHLRGKLTIGAYALDPDSRAKWVCLDADDEPEWEGLLDLAHDLSKERIAHYLERSRRGGHLWLFTPTLPGKDIRRFAKALIEDYDAATVEIYPKQDELRTGPGSLVRLPLGVHQKTGKRYSFVTLDGQPLAPTVREQIRLLANPDRVPQSFIAGVLQSAPAAQTVSSTPRFAKHDAVAGETVSERIKNAISVYDFVSQFVQLDRGGRGLCPFHDDHVESFAVSGSGNYWNCFAGCGGGSVIDFWSKWRELHGQSPDFTETVTELAKMLL